MSDDSIWPDDLVEKLKDVDFAEANRMLARGQRLMYGYGALPRASEEPEPAPESKRYFRGYRLNAA